MSSADLKKLHKQLRQKIKDEGGMTVDKLEDWLRKFDADNSHMLEEQEFYEALMTWGMETTKRDASIYFREMAEKFHGPNASQVDFVEFVFSLLPPMNRDRKGITKKAFELLDTDNSGSISRDELMGGSTCKHKQSIILNHPLVRAGLESEMEEMRHFMDFSRDKTTVGVGITLKMFTQYVERRVSVFCPRDEEFGECMSQLFGLPYVADDVLEKTMEMIRKRLAYKFKDDPAKVHRAIDKAFRKFDVDQSGGIDEPEFKLFLKKCSVWLSDGASDGIFNHFDHDGNGVISKQEFKDILQIDRWIAEHQS